MVFTTTRSTTGATDWVDLKPGENLIEAISSGWGNAALIRSYDGVAEYPVTINDTDVTTTTNNGWIVDGPGKVRLEISAVVNPITLINRSAEHTDTRWE